MQQQQMPYMPRASLLGEMLWVPSGSAPERKHTHGTTTIWGHWLTALLLLIAIKPHSPCLFSCLLIGYSTAPSSGALSRKFTGTPTHLRTRTRTRTRTHTHTHTHIHTHICTHTHTHKHMQTRIPPYPHRHTHAHTHTHTV